LDSKKKIHAEVIANQIIGIANGWFIVYFIFPLFDSFDQSITASISSIIFFASSYFRIYIIRRIFNRM